MPKWALLTVTLILVSIVGHGGRSMVVCIGNEIATSQLNRQEQENLKLSERFSDLKYEADSIEQLLALLETHDNQLRIYENMEISPADARALGVGGPAQESAELIELGEMGSGYYAETVELDQKIDMLLRKVRFQEESFTEIENKISKDQFILDHTPSVNPTEGRLTSGFGYRIDPFLHYPQLHTGVDIANEPGTPIQASADGVVSFTGWLTGYGNTVKIDHGNGIETLYGHLDEFCVKQGQSVFRGEVIATMGNTGRSTGPHLHYEVRVGGRPVNPKGYFLTEEE